MGDLSTETATGQPLLTRIPPGAEGVGDGMGMGMGGGTAVRVIVSGRVRFERCSVAVVC